MTAFDWLAFSDPVSAASCRDAGRFGETNPRVMPSFGVDDYTALLPAERSAVDRWLEDEGLKGRFVFQVDVVAEGTVRVHSYALRDGKPFAVGDDVAIAEPFLHGCAAPPPFPARFWS